MCVCCLFFIGPYGAIENIYHRIVVHVAPTGRGKLFGHKTECFMTEVLSNAPQGVGKLKSFFKII